MATRDILASLSGEPGNNDLLFAKALANQSLFVTDSCNLRVYTEPPGICELQKMDCLPEARGTVLAHKLLAVALEYAKRHYDRCYLETLGNMVAAQKFYEKYGFARIDAPPAQTGHFACDILYLKDLKA